MPLKCSCRLTAGDLEGFTCLACALHLVTNKRTGVSANPKSSNAATQTRLARTLLCDAETVDPYIARQN